MTQPLGWVARQQALEQRQRVRRQELRVLDLALQDLLLQLVARLGAEGRHAAQHLVQQDTSAPPVHRLGVALAINDLRCHVLHGANERVGARAVVAHVGLGQPKVGQLDVALAVQQHVLRLQVPVCNAQGVKVANGQHNLGRVQARHVLGKDARAVQVEKQVAAVDEVEHNVQPGGGLERKAKVDNVGVHHGRQHVALGAHVLAVVLGHDALLLHHLHRVHVLRGLVLHLEHLAECALADDAQHLKILGPDLSWHAGHVGGALLHVGDVPLHLHLRALDRVGILRASMSRGNSRSWSGLASCQAVFVSRLLAGWLGLLLHTG
mmetsp:Transcript_14126/g.34839  ORF Transcript_14126/g.34839 Transcript_14126/m.34839 type:complete len:322 (+) Transcript_14126:1519-2484(+)